MNAEASTSHAGARDGFFIVPEYVQHSNDSDTALSVVQTKLQQLLSICQYRQLAPHERVLADQLAQAQHVLLSRTQLPP